MSRQLLLRQEYDEEDSPSPALLYRLAEALDLDDFKVEQSGFTLNQQLTKYPNRPPGEVEDLSRQHRSSMPYRRKQSWRVCDRLSELQIAHIVAAFKAGMPKHALAWLHATTWRNEA